MKTPPKTEQVTLLKDHTHGGKPYKQGEPIAVTPKQKAFLQERGKVAADAAAKTTKAEKE